MNSRNMLTIVCGLALAGSLMAQDFEYGVVTNFKKYPKSSEYYIGQLKRAGFTSFRSAISWQYVEKKKGVYAVPADFSLVEKQYQAASKNGLKPIFILGYGNKLYDESGLVTTDQARAGFANYAKWVATHFRGQVRYYEIWNEWFKGSRQFGDKSIEATVPDYVKLVAVAAAAIKAADPSAIVLAGGADGSAGWVQRFAAAGGLAQIDGLSIHPYNYTQFFQNGFTPESSIEMMKKLHDELKLKYKKDVSFYVTEIGWPTSDRRYTDAAQSAFVERYYILARAAGFIKGVWWYELSDSGTNFDNNEDNFGLLNYSGEPKLSFKAFAGISKLLVDSANVSVTTDGADMQAILFDGTGKKAFGWTFKDIPSGSFLKNDEVNIKKQSDESRLFTPRMRVDK